MDFTLDTVELVSGASTTLTSLMPIMIIVGGLIFGFAIVKGIISVAKKGKNVG